ncbi:MAG: PAS domain S-box protein, partial [Limisphaerales bacterium]
MPTNEPQSEFGLAEHILETVREALLILDDGLHVIKANECFYQTFHVSPDETLHRRIYDLGNGQWDIPALRDLLERILPENTQFDDFEVEHTFESIGRRTMLVNARRVVDAGEKILLAIEDITKRREIEKATFLLSSVVECSEDSIVTVDFDGIITTWNRSAERTYGYSAAEVIGQSLEVLSTPEEAVPLSTYFEKVRRSAKVEHVEIQRVRKDGRRIWLSVQFSPIKDAEGKIIGISTISRDITERHATTAALMESEALLQKALSGKTVGVLFFNLSGRMLNANETFSRMCGYTRHEILHSVHWKMLTAPEFLEVSFQTAESLATTGEAVPYEKQMIRKDGSRWWGLFAPMRLNDRGWESDCMEFIIDITERKRAEEELQSHRQLLETMVNFLPAGVALVRGSDLSFQMVNPRYQALKPDRQMAGKTIDAVWPEAMPLVAERYRRVLETGEAFHIFDEPYQIRRKVNGPVESAYFTWSIHRVDLPG